MKEYERISFIHSREDWRGGNQRKAIRKLSFPLALTSLSTRRVLLQLLENNWKTCECEIDINNICLVFNIYCHVTRILVEDRHILLFRKDNN